MVFTQDDSFRISIKKLSVKKLDGEGEIELYGEKTEKIGDAIHQFTIKESILPLESTIVGSLVIREPGHMIDDFVMTGQNEILHIEMNTPTVPDSDVTLELCVSECNRIDNVAELSGIMGENLTRNYYKIKLVSCESLYYNMDILTQEQNAEFMNKDRFLKIATSGEGGGEEEGPQLGGLLGVAGDIVEGLFEEEEEEEKEGLVNTLAPKYFNGGKWHVENPMEIEGTHNSIWLKANQNMYPWGKLPNQMPLMQLMSNLAENSLDKDQKHANFLFWNDFDGWHFKSVAKMIKENKNNILKSSQITYTLKTPYVYAKGPAATSKKSFVKDKGDPRLFELSGNRETNHLGLWQNGAYSSYYEYIKPNYDDPYHNYLDTSSSIKTKFINYSYQDVWPNPDECLWETVETYKLLPSKIKTENDKDSPNKTRRLKKNDIYGYFGSAFNDETPNKYDYLSSRIENGKMGKQNNVMWQTVLDQTDLKISQLEKIYKNIIEPTKENYARYLHLQNLKEKWNVYRHSICCEKQDTKMQFFAVIDDARLISDDGGEANSGGIYEYTWREVELWPSDAINEWPDGVEPEILTNEEAPISVVVVPNGLRGGPVDEEENGADQPSDLGSAWNLNELMNVKEDDNIFVGPGINVADKDFNDYPESYQMMPVGGYFKVGEDPCAEDHEDKIHFHKHIVQMNRIPSYMLEFISPLGSTVEEEDEDISLLEWWEDWVSGILGVPLNGDEDEEQTEQDSELEEIFFFDVPNAHDGLCDCIE